jgi:hypothetical protein
MAIRIGPPPNLARLRLYWHVTLSQYRRRPQAFQESYAPTQPGLLERWVQQGGRLLTRLHPRNRMEARRRADFTAFSNHYEDLVDLLCWAAKDGVHTDRDARYAELRAWMHLNYHRVRPLLRPHLGPWEGTLDPFEELFAPESVDDVINDAAGILYVTQTRRALDACEAAQRSDDTSH